MWLAVEAIDCSPTAHQFLLRLFLCFLCLVGAGNARPRRVVSKTVPDHFRALALDKQKLTGVLGSRLRANSEGFLENINLTALLQPLTTENAESEAADRGFAGQFLDAAADSFEYNHDLQLRAQMDKVAAALGSVAKHAANQLGTSLTDLNLSNTRCDLVGLLAYYRVTSDSAAYTAAQAVAGSLLKLTTNADRQSAASEIVALAQAGLIQPMVTLYRLSGNRQYLDFCLSLSKSVRLPQLSASTPADTLDRALIALDGLADLYEVTGNGVHLSQMQAAWKQIASSRLAVIGAPRRTDKVPTVVDACTASLWLQFTFKLLRITGEPLYADYLERTIYNQVLGSQDVRNGNISAETPLNGTKNFSGRLTPQTGACMLREAKAIALLPRIVWGRYETGIAINLYNPGRAFFTLRKHGMVQIYSEANFPATGEIQLHVEPSAKAAHFPLRLRVPSWTEGFSVEIADIHLKGAPGEVVVVDRDWKSGDTVHISMALPLHKIPTIEKKTDELFLQRGPQILALNKALNPDIADLRTAYIRPLSGDRYQIANFDDKLPRDFTGDQVYRINGEADGKARDLVLIPFADANSYLTVLRKQPD